jgi:hypothetical protein
MEWVWFSLCIAAVIVALLTWYFKRKGNKKALKILDIFATAIDIAKGHIPMNDRVPVAEMNKTMYPHTFYVKKAAEAAGVTKEVDDLLSSIGANKNGDPKP